MEIKDQIKGDAEQNSSSVTAESPLNALEEGKAARTCDDCKFCLLVDYGYSNYTTEGTEFYCAKRLHPNGTFDHWYGEDERLRYAEQCEGFEAGEGISMDVDMENLSELTPEQKVIWKMHEDAP